MNGSSYDLLEATREAVDQFTAEDRAKRIATLQGEVERLKESNRRECMNCGSRRHWTRECPRD